MVEFNTSTAPPVVPSAESGSRSSYSTAMPMQTGAPSTMPGQTAHKSTLIEKAKEKLGHMRIGDKRPPLGQMVVQAPVYQGSGYQGPIAPATVQMPVTQMSATQMPATNMPVTHMPSTEMPVTQMPVTYVQEPHMPATHMPATRMPVTNMPATQMPVTHMPATQMPVTHMPATHMPAAQMSASQVPITAPTVGYNEQVTDPLYHEMKILENMGAQCSLLCSSITNWKGLVGDQSRYMASFSTPSTNTAWCSANATLKRAGDEMRKMMVAMDMQIVTPLAVYRERIDSELNDFGQQAKRAKESVNKAEIVKLQAEDDTKVVHMTDEEKNRRQHVQAEAQDQYDTVMLNIKNGMAHTITCTDKVLQAYAIFFMEIQREYYEKCASLMKKQEDKCRQMYSADHDNYQVENTNVTHNGNGRPYENGYSITGAHHGRNSMTNSFHPSNGFVPANNQSGVAPHNAPFAPIMMHNGGPTLMSHYPSTVRPPVPTQSSPKPMANISEPMDYPMNHMNRIEDVKRSKRAYDHDQFRNGSGNHMRQMHPEHPEKNMMKSTRSRTPPLKRSPTPNPFSPYKSDGEYEDAKSDYFGPSRTFPTTTTSDMMYVPAGDMTRPMSAGRSEVAKPMMSAPEMTKPMMTAEQAPEMTKPTMVTEQGMTKTLPGAISVMPPMVAPTTTMTAADEVPIMTGAPEILATRPDATVPITPMAGMDPMNTSGGSGKKKKNTRNR